MHVIGHDHESSHVEPIPAANSFQHDNKCVARLRLGEQRAAAITTERNEMNISSLLVSLQSPGHGARLRPCASFRCDGRTRLATLKYGGCYKPRPLAKNARRAGHPLFSLGNPGPAPGHKKVDEK